MIEFTKEKVGLFDMVDLIFHAIEQGEFKKDIAMDSPDRGEYFIVEAAAFPQKIYKEQSVVAAGRLVTLAFIKQLADQMDALPALFDFGVTRHKDTGCFYFKWHEEKPMDIVAARQYIDGLKLMFTEVVSSDPTFHDDQFLCLGPLTRKNSELFREILSRLFFHSDLPENFGFDAPAYYAPDGEYVAFNRAEILALFKYEKSFSPELKNISPPKDVLPLPLLDM